MPARFDKSSISDLTPRTWHDFQGNKHLRNPKPAGYIDRQFAKEGELNFAREEWLFGEATREFSLTELRWMCVWEYGRHIPAICGPALEAVRNKNIAKKIMGLAPNMLINESRAGFQRSNNSLLKDLSLESGEKFGDLLTQINEAPIPYDWRFALCSHFPEFPWLGIRGRENSVIGGRTVKFLHDPDLCLSWPRTYTERAGLDLDRLYRFPQFKAVRATLFKTTTPCTLDHADDLWTSLSEAGVPDSLSDIQVVAGIVPWEEFVRAGKRGIAGRLAWAICQMFEDGLDSPKGEGADGTLISVSAENFRFGTCSQELIGENYLGSDDAECQVLLVYGKLHEVRGLEKDGGYEDLFDAIIDTFTQMKSERSEVLRPFSSVAALTEVDCRSALRALGAFRASKTIPFPAIASFRDDARTTYGNRDLARGDVRKRLDTEPLSARESDQMALSDSAKKWGSRIFSHVDSTAWR